MPQLSSGPLIGLDATLFHGHREAQAGPRQRMRAKRPLQAPPPESGIVLDDAEVAIKNKMNTSKTHSINVKAPPEASPGGLQVFRLLHTSPKLQKTMRSPAATLRGDHVAIAMASMESRCKETRSLTLSGDRHSSGIGVRVLGLADFLEVGSKNLKARFVRCVVAPEVEYNVHGCSLPSLCHSAQGRSLLTSIMESNAVPGANVFFPNEKSRQQIPDIDEIIGHFKAAGVLQDAGVENSVQLSSRGLEVLHYSRRCTDFIRFFQRRAGIAIVNLTQWELIDNLVEHGWQLQALELKKRYPPLPLTGNLDDLNAEQKVVMYHPANLELGRSYLQCLNSLEKIKQRGHFFMYFFVLASLEKGGVTELRHRGSAAYYDGLLGKDAAHRKMPMIVDSADSNEHISPSLRALGQRQLGQQADVADAGSPPLLALMDREEGDPLSDEEEGEEDAAPAHQRRRDDKSVKDFSPFKFTRTARVIAKGPRAGQLQKAWQVQCPFHRDKGDDANTFCRRAMNFDDEAEEPEVLLRLKLWCVKGRGCSSRAILPGGHKFMNVKGSAPPKLSDLEAQLAAGLASKTWIKKSAAAASSAAADGDLESAESSDSGSSSSS